jgi:hypothetical protein
VETFVLVVIVTVGLIYWALNSSRLKDIESRVNGLVEQQAHQNVEALQRRVAALEGELRSLRGPSIAAAPPPPTPVKSEPPPPRPVHVDRYCGFCGKTLPPAPALCPCRMPAQAPAPPEPLRPETPPPLPLQLPPVEPPPPVLQPKPTPEPRKPRGKEDWEALVGGNLLNKLGILLLVIGTASLLGYASTMMGPVGRSIVGLALSLTLLIGGVIVEKRDKYRTFARGLIGGGWAALYFTAYAMHALEATKVIESPVLGVLLLGAVAIGMIVHSLRYRSETVTGLAYFVAFATFAFTPLTTLSVVSLVPLAASLLYVAYRFTWSKMTVFGVIATYLSCAAHGDSGAPLWTAQLLFCIYWLIFEIFDVLRAARRTRYDWFESAVLPLNALGFCTLSEAKWHSSWPGHAYLLAAAIGAAYLAGALIRARVRPPSSFAENEGLLVRLTSGGYESPITIMAVLTACAVLLHLDNQWSFAGVIAEAELFFLAGLYFRESYPRYLAAGLFGVAYIDLLLFNVPRPHNTWTPAAFASGLILYLNRYLRKMDLAFGYAASSVVALVLASTVAQAWIGVSLYLFAAGLFAFGLHFGLLDFRIQAYGAATLGLFALSISEVDKPTRWLPLTCAAVLTYSLILTLTRFAKERVQTWESSTVAHVGSFVFTGLLMTLVYRNVPQAFVGVGWMALALALLELGLRELPTQLRRLSYLVAGFGAIYVLFGNVAMIENTGQLDNRIACIMAAGLAYSFATRVYGWQRSDAETNRAIDVFSAFGTLFILVGLWALLPSVAVAPAWAIVAMILLELGIAIDRRWLIQQSDIAMGASFVRLYFANFVGLGSTAGISHRLLTVGPAIAAYYYQWSRSKQRVAGRFFLWAAAIACVTLMRFELGRVYTVAGWALFAIGLLLASRRWQVPDFRWQSYLIAVLAFARAWSTNFLAPDSFGGTPVRLLIAAIVIASFFACEILTPQDPAERPGIRPWERHARLFYSMLGAVLLTVLLYHEVSGTLLTVAWTLEGLALIAAGFPLRDRILRLSGLTLFLICILKVFFYDLRTLETIYRIVSFIVLGGILVGVSWIYTRFRDRIQRYL